jgi:hypothetical protein
MTRKYLWQAGIAVAVVGAASVGAIGLASATGDTTGDNTVRAAAQTTTDPDGDWHGGPWGHGGRWGGPGRGGPFGGIGGFGDIAGADVTDILHGEVVLAKEGGGTQTVLVQKGTVTEVGATGVTVRSGDGFTTSYTVNGDTVVRADSDRIDSVAKDEEVVVVAPKSGDNHTATAVVDLTDLGWK